MRTPEQKIEKYEALLHQIQLCAEVTLDAEKTKKLIRNICRWSYAHRMGNGEFTEKQQENLIDACFERLLEV